MRLFFNWRKETERKFLQKCRRIKITGKKPALDMRCCGSIFRNPLPEYAGRLIEEAGLKGYSIGGAKVSEKHANFIVNTGNATADDVLSLIRHIKNVIFEKRKITLETEVEIIGRS